MEEDIVSLLRTRLKNKSGIIYCISRKDCEQLSHSLKTIYKIKCDFYHANLSHEKRSEIQSRWMSNEIYIIIATIAFGMGINKKDVRFVIHYSMPKSLEGYSQECGRAGRDQKQAECILYYAYSDRKLNDFFICSGENSVARKKQNLKALYKILEFCEEPYLCRRKIQMDFLGEQFNPVDCHAMCDNCKKGVKVVVRSMKHETSKVLHLIQHI